MATYWNVYYVRFLDMQSLVVMDIISCSGSGTSQHVFFSDRFPSLMLQETLVFPSPIPSPTCGEVVMSFALVLGMVMGGGGGGAGRMW